MGMTVSAVYEFEQHTTAEGSLCLAVRRPGQEHWHMVGLATALRCCWPGVRHHKPGVLVSGDPGWVVGHFEPIDLYNAVATAMADAPREELFW